MLDHTRLRVAPGALPFRRLGAAPLAPLALTARLRHRRAATGRRNDPPAREVLLQICCRDSKQLSRVSMEGCSLPRVLQVPDRLSLFYLVAASIGAGVALT